MNTQQAFQQGAAWQQAYSLLFLGRRAKLFRTEDGEWICEEVGK